MGNSLRLTVDSEETGGRHFVCEAASPFFYSQRWILSPIHQASYGSECQKIEAASPVQCKDKNQHRNDRGNEPGLVYYPKHFLYVVLCFSVLSALSAGVEMKQYTIFNKMYSCVPVCTYVYAMCV